MKNLLSCLIFVCSCFMGCEDFLDQEPGTQVSITEQLSSRIGVEQAFSRVYYDIEALLSSRHILYADVQGGNITFTPRISDQIVTVPGGIENSYHFSDMEEDSDYAGYYEELYIIINQVNVILEYFDEYSFFTDQERSQLQAELLTLRAFAHYLVAIHYAQNYHYTADASHLGIVYNTTTLALGVDFPARLTLSGTYDFIKADLDAALASYTDNTLLSTEPAYAYFNRMSTQALYARIALQMNDWEQARAFSNEVITTSGVVLATTGNYISEWELDEDPVSEVILEFSAPRNSDGNVSSSISEHFIYNSPTNYSDYVASGDLLDLYDTADIRSNMFLEIYLATFSNQEQTAMPYYFTKKFQGNAGTTCIRLSEMYLNRAEANARLNNPGEALADLNTIRERANLAPLTGTEDILNEIFLERRRELAFEGHLLFDILRYKKDVTRDQGCLSQLCNLSYPSHYFILPIPFSSTGLNENIVQNDGY
ncbi:MAG: RagB/SusD family nutrient uptake outer membrane protein [Cytophagales bacterium]|nr:RagB/SusD family nutrient uptake outer membrane protein [Cytophagales bacterium]